MSVELLEFCETEAQTRNVEAFISEGSVRGAAEKLGLNRNTIKQSLLIVEAAAALKGMGSGLNYPIAPGFKLKGFSAYAKDANGNPTWYKADRDKAAENEAHLKFIEGLASKIKPAKGTKVPKVGTDQLASAIIFGDAHLGMLAHAIETLGDDHSLETGTADIRAAIDYLVDSAPSSEEGWFLNVGDWSHADSTKGQTNKGTSVDMAARHNQVMRAAGTLIRYCIDKMLTKFTKVIVINARGNHDKDAAFALNMYIDAVYEKEPRVDVRGNDSKFNFIEFGKCLIGVSHGDGINANRLAGVMTTKAAEAWGRTTFRRWWQGHIHHKQAFEHDSGVTIESFHTLAPIDAWHSDSGYGSEQRVTMITLHREYGEVNRMSPSLNMIRALK